MNIQITSVNEAVHKEQSFEDLQNEGIRLAEKFAEDVPAIIVDAFIAFFMRRFIFGELDAVECAFELLTSDEKKELIKKLNEL